LASQILIEEICFKKYQLCLRPVVEKYQLAASEVNREATKEESSLVITNTVSLGVTFWDVLIHS
jgi:hypothetical protein